jgi:hypothetical protein
MKIMVVTSCTASKKYTIPDKTYQLKAIDMYQGSFLPVKKGTLRFQEEFGKDSLDLVIISAGYGVLDQDDLIIPYEKTFASMKKKERFKSYQELNLKKDLHDKINAANYDLIVVGLGLSYLEGIFLHELETNTPMLLIAQDTFDFDSLKGISNLKVIKTTKDTCSVVRAPSIKVKQILTEKVLNSIIDLGLNEFLLNPTSIFDENNKGMFL